MPEIYAAERRESIQREVRAAAVKEAARLAVRSMDAAAPIQMREFIDQVEDDVIGVFGQMGQPELSIDAGRDAMFYMLNKGELSFNGEFMLQRVDQ